MSNKYFGPSIVAFGVAFGLVLLILNLVTGGHRPTAAVGGSVEARIAPVGEVNTGAPIVVAKAEAPAPAAAGGAARSGEEVYNGACMACHASGAAGAPIVGDAGAWGPRIAQGMDTLVQHALNGFNAMPARGTCATCSDDEIRNAIEFMVNKSQ